MAISPSAIEVYDDCKRKYAGKYWGADFGWPRAPQAKSAALGSEVHAIAEAYLLTGKQPDRLSAAGDIFISGMGYLPGPGAGGVEGEYNASISGIEYNLIIDYRGPLPARAMFEGRNEDVDRVVLDHKTSSNMKEHGIWGREAFLRKPQPLIYGAADLIKSKDSKTRLRWLYYSTKGARKALPSDATLTRAEVADGFGKLIHPTAFEMVQLKKARPDPNSVEANPNACKNYGGCPFRERAGGPCRITRAQAIAGMFGVPAEGNTMGLLDELKAGVTPGFDPPSAPAPAPQPGGLLSALGGVPAVPIATQVVPAAPGGLLSALSGIPAAQAPALAPPAPVPGAGGLLAALGGVSPNANIAPMSTIASTGAVLTAADKINPPELRTNPTPQVAPTYPNGFTDRAPLLGPSPNVFKVVFQELSAAFGRMADRI